MRELFSKFALAASGFAASMWAFAAALAVLAVWAVTGPIMQFSDTWLLLINTFTSIVTFLMVFLIQNTQGRNTKALQLKLDELIRGVEGARTGMVKLEARTEGELDELQDEFEQIRTGELPGAERGIPSA